MYDVYLVNKTIIAILCDDNKKWIGEVYPTRELALGVFFRVTEDLDAEGNLGSKTSIVS